MIDWSVAVPSVELLVISPPLTKKLPPSFWGLGNKGGAFYWSAEGRFFWGFLARFTWENTSETLQKHNFRRVNRIREGAFSKKLACGGLHSQQCSIYNVIPWSIPRNFNLQAAIAFSTHAQNDVYTVLKLYHVLFTGGYRALYTCIKHYLHCG